MSLLMNKPDATSRRCRDHLPLLNHPLVKVNQSLTPSSTIQCCRNVRNNNSLHNSLSSQPRKRRPS